MQFSPVEVIVAAEAAAGRIVTSVEVNGVTASYWPEGSTWSAPINLDSSVCSPETYYCDLNGGSCPCPGDPPAESCELPRCTVSAAATDDTGVSASTSIAVWFADVTNLPLTVTSFLPKSEAENVEVEEIIQIFFSKPVNPDTVSSALEVTAQLAGQPEPVTGGISYLPGLQLVTFTPYTALEYKTRVDVTIDHTVIQPQEGPGMESIYRSYFFTRPFPTVVRGVISGDNFLPLQGVKVGLVDWNLQPYDPVNWVSVTDAKGNFSIGHDLPAELVPPEGEPYILIDGSGVTNDAGEWYSSVILSEYIQAERINSFSPLVLAPVDKTSAEYLKPVTHQTLTFNDRIPGFSFTVKADSARFADGKSEGMVYAREVGLEVNPYVLPEGIYPNYLVQLQPPGIVLAEPGEVVFGNTEGLDQGYRVLLIGMDPKEVGLGIFGLGEVQGDGIKMVEGSGTGPVAMDFVGYSIPTPEYEIQLHPEAVTTTALPSDDNNVVVGPVLSGAEGLARHDKSNVCHSEADAEESQPSSSIFDVAFSQENGSDLAMSKASSLNSPQLFADRYSLTADIFDVALSKGEPSGTHSAMSKASSLLNSSFGIGVKRLLVCKSV